MDKPKLIKGSREWMVASLNSRANAIDLVVETVWFSVQKRIPARQTAKHANGILQQIARDLREFAKAVERMETPDARTD